MNKILLLLSFITTGVVTRAQFKAFPSSETWKKEYRATADKENDLTHTKLDVSFDFEKSYLYGKAQITLRPHFYATDSLKLDAKGMDIKKVAVLKDGKQTTLNYNYNDNYTLRIKLDKVYKRNEPYTVYIEYTAKPEELKTKGSAAIQDAKGLYFINPLGKEKDKPTEIWTQGETEASSAWFPTIDKPNQKTTSEISMTVPAKYVTLSNGKMTSQRKNPDGTRTDTWVMELSHSPYLFFMGVGDYAIVKDSYKGKEVSYYVEKDYEKVARKIFGYTPEMMSFYSTVLGVEYPWVKYSQMVGRNYVSGAMENTTATLHSEYLQQSARELIDGNKYEDYISHELFHQWFGDLVTAESWSNLTVNESMANYGEYLWDEYKHGKDAAQQRNYKQMNEYFESGGENKNLVRFYYRDKEDMFDRVTYEKGGRILNMLRNFVGDSAFFRSLNLYLNTNKFKNAEAHQMRLAFEEVTGKDLNWFWNQWYYGSGHPKLDINYSYDPVDRKAIVVVQQNNAEDKLFKLPVAIDVYIGGRKTRHNIWVENKSDTFRLDAATKPDLVNFDGDKVLLAEKKENKNLADYMYQYKVAGNYVDRREALDFAIEKKSNDSAKRFIVQVLKDPYFELRQTALQNVKASDLDAASISVVETMAKADPRRTVRAAAIDVLSDLNNKAYRDLFVAGAKDSSYSVSGASLSALAAVDEAKAIELLPSLKSDAKGRLKSAVSEVEVLTKTEADFSAVTDSFDKAKPMEKFGLIRGYINYLGKVNNTDNFKKGINKAVSFRNLISGFAPEFKNEVNEQLRKLREKKISLKSGSNNNDIDEQVKFIDEKLK